MINFVRTFKGLKLIIHLFSDKRLIATDLHKFKEHQKKSKTLICFFLLFIMFLNIIIQRQSH